MTDDTITVSVSGTTEEIYNKLRGRAGNIGKSFSAVWAEDMQRVAEGGEMGGALVSIIGIVQAQAANYEQRIDELEAETAKLYKMIGCNTCRVVDACPVDLESHCSCYVEGDENV